MAFRNISVPVLTLLFILTALPVPGAPGSKIPSHPERLEYSELDWEVPTGQEYRLELDNGLPVYIKEDRSFPVIKMKLYIRYGTVLIPEGREGICGLTGTLMYKGGTEKYPADTLKELIERLAVNLSFSCDNNMLSVSADFLSEHKEIVLDILNQILFHPVFDKEKVEQEKRILSAKINHRYDNPGPILSDSYQKLMFPGEPVSRTATEKSINSVKRSDIAALHGDFMKNKDMILAVSGDFNKDDMKKELESLFPQKRPDSDSTVFPQIKCAPGTKCIIVHKPMSQIYVRAGLPLFARPHEDYYPASLMNVILGGSGFTSRLGNKIRSDAGLTYSIYSRAESSYFIPGTFYISFFTNNDKFGEALSMTLKEVTKFKKDGITESELDEAVNLLVEGFPSSFRSARDIVENYAYNEYFKRSEDHFTSYEKKLKSITVNDVNRTAEKYLDIDNFRFIIVGDTSAIFSKVNQEHFPVKKLDPLILESPEDIHSLFE